MKAGMMTPLSAFNGFGHSRVSKEEIAEADKREREYFENSEPLLKLQNAILDVFDDRITGYEIAKGTPWMTPVARNREQEKKAADAFLENWEDIKAEVRKLGKPSYRDIDNICSENFKKRLDEKIAAAAEDAERAELEAVRPLEYTFQLFNIMQDMDMYLSNCGYYEECVSFCRDLLEIFDFEDDRECEMKTKLAIGGCLSDIGYRLIKDGKEDEGRAKYAESDEWYEKILGEAAALSGSSAHPAPNAVEANAVVNYLLTLEMRKSDEANAKARSLLGKYVDEDTVFTEENELLLERAADMYAEVGDAEKGRFFQRKREQYRSRNTDTVVREKKVYPNDPCPCGSGKKYKKCCGRKK